MKNYSFLEELLILGNIKDHCNSIDIGPHLRTIPILSGDATPAKAGEVRSYWDLPDYMKVAFHGLRGKEFERSVALYEGSYIELGKYRDLDHFLKQKLSSNRRSKIRATKRNLERIFPIEYGYYYGAELPDSTYDKLMDSLKAMISVRFEEKGMDHVALGDWDNFRKRGKKLIADKKAALIVIYSDGAPIHISFNYVWEKMVFGYVRGFDLDYSKFYLGFIDILIQFEWCFKNQFQIYDLLRGNLDYKLMFADATYLYRAHYIVPSIKRNPLGLLPWIKCSLKFDVYYSIKGKLADLYHSLPFSPKRDRDKIIAYQLDEPTVEESMQLEKNQMSKVPLEPEPREYLKRAAYHFLYSSKTPKKELEVYGLPGQRDIYFFKGNGQIKKVRFTDSIID